MKNDGKKEERGRRDGARMLVRTLPWEGDAPIACSTGCLKLQKPLESLEIAQSDVPSSPRKPTRCPQMNWLQGMCSHKSREDKTKTLIVAISPLV